MMLMTTQRKFKRCDYYLLIFMIMDNNNMKLPFSLTYRCGIWWLIARGAGICQQCDKQVLCGVLSPLHQHLSHPKRTGLLWEADLYHPPLAGQTLPTLSPQPRSVRDKTTGTFQYLQIHIFTLNCWTILIIIHISLIHNTVYQVIFASFFLWDF